MFWLLEISGEYALLVKEFSVILTPQLAIIFKNISLGSLRFHWILFFSGVLLKTGVSLVTRLPATNFMHFYIISILSTCTLVSSCMGMLLVWAARVEYHKLGHISSIHLFPSVLGTKSLRSGFLIRFLIRILLVHLFLFLMLLSSHGREQRDVCFFL